MLIIIQIFSFIVLVIQLEEKYQNRVSKQAFRPPNPTAIDVTSPTPNIPTSNVLISMDTIFEGKRKRNRKFQVENDFEDALVSRCKKVLFEKYRVGCSVGGIVILSVG